MFHYRCFAAFSGVGWFQGVTNGCRSLDFRPPVSDGFELLQTVARSWIKYFVQKFRSGPLYVEAFLPATPMNYAERFRNSTTQDLADLRSLREVHLGTSSGRVCVGLAGQQGLLEREPRTGRTA
jgi:hypothetical protein